MLVVTQMREADRALLGVDDLNLQPTYSKCRLTMAVCTSVTTKQCQHAVAILVSANPGPPGKWPLKWRERVI